MRSRRHALLMVGLALLGLVGVGASPTAPPIPGGVSPLPAAPGGSETANTIGQIVIWVVLIAAWGLVLAGLIVVRRRRKLAVVEMEALQAALLANSATPAPALSGEGEAQPPPSA